MLQFGEPTESPEPYLGRVMLDQGEVWEKTEDGEGGSGRNERALGARGNSDLLGEGSRVGLSGCEGSAHDESVEGFHFEDWMFRRGLAWSF